MRWLFAVILFYGVTAKGQTFKESFGTGTNQFSIEFVVVGSPSNAPMVGKPINLNVPDQSYGSVGYVYSIGKYEIRRDAVLKATTEGALEINLTGDTNRINQPPAGFDFVEAARFVNWLNTSKGFPPAYKFNATNLEFWGPQEDGYDHQNPCRNSKAKYWIPNRDEWIKAAHFDTNKNGIGPGYWLYTTKSDTPPVQTSGGVIENSAVYNFTAPHDPADVTYSGGLGPWGTMGQGGNMREWIDEAWDESWDGPLNSPNETRAVRGGNFLQPEVTLTPWYRSGGAVSNGDGNTAGLRVATTQPSTLVTTFFDHYLGGSAGNKYATNNVKFICNNFTDIFSFDGDDPGGDPLSMTIYFHNQLRSQVDFKSGRLGQQFTYQIQGFGVMSGKFKSGSLNLVLAEDSSKNYVNIGPASGINKGYGFGSWTISSDGGPGGFAGMVVGNPSQASITGFDGSAFGLYANNTNSANAYVNAERPFLNPLGIGEEICLKWGLNFDSGNGNKGFSIYAGGVSGIEVLNVNQGGYPGDITINGTNSGISHGFHLMEWKIKRITGNVLEIYSTDRSGSTNMNFRTSLTFSGQLNLIKIYASNLPPGQSAREPYFDDLKIQQSIQSNAQDITFLSWNGGESLSPDKAYLLNKYAFGGSSASSSEDGIPNMFFSENISGTNYLTLRTFARTNDQKLAIYGEQTSDLSLPGSWSSDNIVFTSFTPSNAIPSGTEPREYRLPIDANQPRKFFRLKAVLLP